MTLKDLEIGKTAVVTVVGGEGLREELLLSVLLKRNCDNDVLG